MGNLCGKEDDSQPRTAADVDDGFAAKYKNPMEMDNSLDDSNSEDIDELIDACTDGEHLTLKQLLDKGVHVDSADPDTGGTALIIAALNGQKECVEVLIKAGAQLEIADPDFGMTAFLWACHSAHLRCVEVLMKAGCDVHVKESSGLGGVELAKENMKLGWERVVELIRDSYTDAQQAEVVVDTENEKAISQARNRRLAKIAGRTGSSDAMQILLSSEKVDNLRSSVAAPQAAVAVEDESDVKRQGLARSATSAKIAEAVVAEAGNDEDSTAQYLQLWDVTPDMLQPIQDWIVRAEKAEAPVTKLLVGACKKIPSAKLSGLEYKLKTMSSMSRKVLEKTNGDPLQFEDFCAAQGDWLRYTMLIDTDSYVSGVELTTAVLAKKGIKEKKMKNFWRKTGEETDYMGINAIYITKQGFPFELQFHTPETLDTKMQRCHHSYEKFREESSIVKAQYWEEMTRMWSLVPIPPGVSKLGKLVIHEMNLAKALAQLTDKERAAIAERKKLEVVVKPMCEWVASHTLKAEKDVTPMLLSLADTVGAKLQGLDFRVKSALSMMRKIVNELRNENHTHNDDLPIEAKVWCEQRNALRYTVVCEEATYTADVRKFFTALQAAGFVEEYCFNYWLDSDPFNAIRTRFWSDDKQAWALVVFHTAASIAMSSERLVHHQNAMGLVFHTATFEDKGALDTAVQNLRMDTSWARRCEALPVPPDAETIVKLVTSPGSNKSGSVLDHGSASAKLRTAEVQQHWPTSLPDPIRNLFAQAEQADRDGRIGEALELLNEAIVRCRKLGSDVAADVKALMQQYETKVAMLSKQRTLAVVSTGVMDYIWIVRMQRRWLASHPRGGSRKPAKGKGKSGKGKGKKK